MADPVDFNVDELRRRARRRLIGAVVLALIVAVVVPMLLESDPKPLGDDVSVKIPPVDESKFVNRLTTSKSESKVPAKMEAPAKGAPPAGAPPPAPAPTSTPQPAPEDTLQHQAAGARVRREGPGRREGPDTASRHRIAEIGRKGDGAARRRESGSSATASVVADGARCRRARVVGYVE